MHPPSDFVSMAQAKPAEAAALALETVRAQDYSQKRAAIMLGIDPPTICRQLALLGLRERVRAERKAFRSRFRRPDARVEFPVDRNFENTGRLRGERVLALIRAYPVEARARLRDLLEQCATGDHAAWRLGMTRRGLYKWRLALGMVEQRRVR